MKLNQTIANKWVGIIGLISILAACGGGGTGTDNNTSSPSKAITAFSLAGVIGRINETNRTIAVTMPYGIDVTALVATFTTTGSGVRVNGTAQISGTTANDFTRPVTYTVTAADGSTANYNVTVAVAPSSAKAITAFSLAGVTGTINETGKTIAVTMPFGTNVTSLIATFSTTGNSVKVGATTQVSGITATNFTNPVIYTVTAADGSTAGYTVTVTVAPDAAKAITAFSLAGVAGTVSETGKTIALTMPYGTDVTSLIATFTTTGASVEVSATNQMSGVTANDFTDPATYTVIAADGSTASYTVTVTVAVNAAKAITAFSLAGVTGTIDETGKTISVAMPSGTDVTSLIATFTTTGASVEVGATTQVSGATANDFTNSVIYTVTAADGSTANYTVTVAIIPPSSIGGTVSGLELGASIVLQLNAGSDHTVAADGAFTFTSTLNGGAAYNVTILSPPAGQPCTLTYGSGTAVLGSDVTNVKVICGPAFVGAFTATGNVITGRYSHTATLLPDGKVLMVGGSDSAYQKLASAELYDPATGTWSATGSLVTARASHTATLLPNGKVLVVGGVTTFETETAELYDPATGTWTATGSLVTGRFFHTATLLPNGKVMVVGGKNASFYGYLGSAELYDPATGVWTPTGSMATGRMNHTATLLPNGGVLAAGGSSANTVSDASAELYDLATGAWTATGSMATARDRHSMTLLPTGKVLVAGGVSGTAPIASAELYDPVAGTWTATSSMASARFTYIALLLPTGKVIVSGGDGGYPSELFDPVSGTWAATGSAAAISYDTATLLSSGKLLLATGNGPYGTVATCQLYW